jgi:DNA-binding XRE family transcriptional regulator
VIGVSGQYAGDELCRDFVENLVGLRGTLKWSQERLATEANVSKGTIAMTESFQRKPLIEHGVYYDKAFGMKKMFEAKARAIQDGAFPMAYRDFPVLEAAAHDLYIYEPSAFPGLLQTERYMRAVLSGWPNVTASELDRRVDARLGRQQAIRREDPPPPRVWALIDETALRRPVAAADVMYEQCMHALEMARLTHVSLAVVPWTSSGRLVVCGPCNIVERDGIMRGMYLDDFVDGRVREDPALVREAAVRFRALQHEALPGGASAEMIERLAKELWQG